GSQIFKREIKYGKKRIFLQKGMDFGRPKNSWVKIVIWERSIW
ncbi:hypothetical protein CGSSp9BS68_10470, partial [Streptococcus pneumoniae SP9-BS68]